ncbi:Ribonuclease H domain - like 10 [Theobroma cacao]|nr:Ribonuclease H domain - like 10 [Theobroma cacao]
MQIVEILLHLSHQTSVLKLMNKSNISKTLNRFGYSFSKGILSKLTFSHYKLTKISDSSFASYQVELWGVYEGLNLAWNLSYKKIDLQVDNKMVVQVINTPSAHPHLNLDLIQAIHSLLQRQREVVIRHVFMEVFKLRP